MQREDEIKREEEVQGRELQVAHHEKYREEDGGKEVDCNIVVKAARERRIVLLMIAIDFGHHTWVSQPWRAFCPAGALEYHR